MFAVIKTGGKQYRVAENDVIKVERLPGAAGDSVDLNEILMVGDGDSIRMGEDLGGAAVSATLLEQTRGEKIIIFKKKRRHNYRRKNGHRQHLTVLRITGISMDGQSRSASQGEGAQGQQDIPPEVQATTQSAAVPGAPEVEAHPS